MARSAQARSKDRTRNQNWKNRRQHGTTSLPGNLTTSANLGLPSVSDRLTELIEPYAEHATSDDAYEKLVTLGMIGWNLANAPDAERGDMMFDLLVAAFPDLEEIFRSASPSADLNQSVNGIAKLDPRTCRDASYFLKIVTELMARKMRLFPGDCRMIVKFFIEDLPDRRILRVTSFFTPDQKPY